MTRKGRVKFKLPSGWWIQRVSDRMNKPCSSCSVVPEGIRVVCTAEGYPYPTTDHYCPKCAADVMRQKVSSENEMISNFTKQYLKESQCAQRQETNLTSSDCAGPTASEKAQPRVRFKVPTRR